MISDVERIYSTSSRDLGFGAVLGACPPNDDESLAELIEADGRLRLRKGKTVDLERYLTEVPDLPQHPDALDAAIDVTLRGLSGSARITPDAVESLARRYPALSEPIREAATLNAAIWSTSGLRQRVMPPPARQMPCEFGPRLLSGQRRYVLEKFLGQGSFGQVYQATDRQLSEEGHRAIVAIKVLADTARTSADRQRLVEEATKVRRISHPNVVQVLDRGVSEDDEDFIVYEYIDGGDLSDLRDDQVPLGPREAASLVMRIARGVHAAHSAGVIHCDLKPSNIMRTAAGEPKVADFGIAVRLQDRASAAATSGSDNRGPIGNIAFISPEQFRGEDAALSVPSDVYALGGILFYLLAARLPNGSTRNEIAHMHDRAHGRGEAPSPRGVVPGIDRDLDAICRRALAPDPQARYSSASSLADDLERWLALRPIDWTRPSAPRRLRLWARRKPAIALASALILGLTIAGAAVAGHFASVANQRKIKVALAEMEIKSKQETDKFNAKIAAIIRNNLSKTKDERLLTDMLVTAWVLEYVYGPKVIDSPEYLQEVWDHRAQAIRDTLAARRANGLDGTLETLLLEHLLAFWLVSSGEHAESIPLLERTTTALSAISPRDPLIDELQVMRLCAEVNLARGEASYDSATVPDLASVEASLRTAEAQLDRDRPRAPIHYLVLNHLATVCEMTGRTQEAAELHAKSKNLLDASHLQPLRAAGIIGGKATPPITVPPAEN